MSLTNTMMALKSDLNKLRRYAFNLNSLSAKQSLLNIIEDKIRYLEDFDLDIINKRYENVFSKIAKHVYPRKKDFFLRKNYDYGEGWPAILDAFREGEIENVVDMVKKLRRWPKDQKEDDKFDANFDTKSENPDSAKKKEIKRAESLIPLNSYCDKEENIEYWKQLKEDNDFNQAIEDFLKYVKEIKC